MNRAVFLDRDHTVIEDPGYIADPEAVKLLPGVGVAIKSLVRAGYKIVVVTNQSGVARGLLTEETLEKIHAEMIRQLSDHGVHIDAIYYCPYHVEGTVEKYIVDSDLRKPKPGMLLKAAEEHDIDLRSSWMIGDSSRDIEAGQRAGCRTVRLRGGTEHFPRGQNDESAPADFTTGNLPQAARIILRQEPHHIPSPKDIFSVSPGYIVGGVAQALAGILILGALAWGFENHRGIHIGSMSAAVILQAISLFFIIRYRPR